MITKKYDENRVECKKKYKVSDYLEACFVGGFAVFFLFIMVYCAMKEHETLWFLLIPIIIILFILVGKFNKPIYIFTNNEARKRWPLFPFFGEKTVFKYSDIDRYCLVFCSYTDAKIIGGNPYVSGLNASKYWFMKGDKVVFSLDSEFQNLEEMKDLLPFPFAGEMQLSPTQYQNRDISGAITRQAMEKIDPETLKREIYVESKGNPFAKPGCIGWMIVLMCAPLLLLSPIAFFVEGTDVSWGGMALMFVCVAFMLWFVFMIGRKSGWVTIDEGKGIIILKSMSKPLRRNKILPLEQVTLVHINRKESKTIIYDENGVWGELRHMAINNYDIIYTALLALKAKGKLKVEED